MELLFSCVSVKQYEAPYTLHFKSEIDILIKTISYNLFSVSDLKHLTKGYRKCSSALQGVSKNCSTFDKILKNKDNMNRLMERSTCS